ncbi:MAG: hypothetical protein WC855_05055 [Thermodesulfovibrionales bacterium]
MTQKKTNYPSVDPFEKKHTLIQRRKFELFKRDPAAQLMEGLLKPEDVTSDIKALLKNGELEKKWNTTIWRTNQPSIAPFSTIMLGMLPRVIGSGVACDTDALCGNPNIVEKIRDFYFVPVKEGDIFIEINPSLLTLNDAKKVKTHVWNIVEREILKRKTKEKSSPKWNPLAPPNEPKTIAFIYATDEKTFRKYLKWYDIRTNEKLSFRVIALIEKSKTPDELLEKVRCKKIKWGIPVTGEDKVEKGFHLIYEAIHRKPYRQKNTKPPIEEYKCPTHPDTECPHSCKYFKDWENRFDRLNPV